MASEKRLIDANNLMEQVKAIHKAVDTSKINTDYDTGFHSATSQVQGLIAYMPTVDAVEVVRCKDCKWFKKGTPFRHECNNICAGMFYVRQEDFCSHGERKDNERKAD